MNDIFLEHKIDCYDMTSFAVYDDKIYFSDNNRNGLYSINLENNVISLETKIPGENELKEILYYGTYLRDSKLFLVPALADEVAVYDICSKDIKKISLESIDFKTKKSNPKFYAICEYEDDIIMIGDYCQFILFVNKSCFSIKMIDFESHLTLFSDADKERLVIRSVKVKDNWMYMPSAIRNIILAYDFNERKLHEILIADMEMNEGIADLIWNKGYVWILTSRNNMLIKAELDGNVFKLIKIYSNKFKKNSECDVGKIICNDNKIYIFPLQGSNIVAFDLCMEEFSIYRKIGEEKDTKNNKWGQTIPFVSLYQDGFIYIDGYKMNIVITQKNKEDLVIELHNESENDKMLPMFINDIMASN